MKAYSWAWTTATVGLVLVGLSATVLAWAPAAILTLFLAAGLVGGSVSALHREKHGQGCLRWSQRLRGPTVDAALTGAVTISMAGLVLLLHGWALPLALLVAATCPATVQRLSAHPRWLSRRRKPPGYDGVTDGRCTHASSLEQTGDQLRNAQPLNVRTMTTDQLCQAWCASYIALQSARATGETARVVSQRQGYLDEFERRDPVGLQAWLATTARAASNPARCLIHPQRRPDERAT